MQLSYLASVSLLATVSLAHSIANQVNQIPSCALSCLTAAVSGADCGLSDYACQCGPARDSISMASNPCLTQACSPAENLRLHSIIEEICRLSVDHLELRSPVRTAPILPVQAAAKDPLLEVRNVSMIGSYVSMITPTTMKQGEDPASTSTAPMTTTATGVTTTAIASPASSTPAAITSSPGDRLLAGGVFAGAAAMVALIL